MEVSPLAGSITRSLSEDALDPHFEKVYKWESIDKTCTLSLIYPSVPNRTQLANVINKWRREKQRYLIIADFINSYSSITYEACTGAFHARTDQRRYTPWIHVVIEASNFNEFICRSQWKRLMSWIICRGTNLNILISSCAQWCYWCNC